ncbi:antirestriction protein ArdA [Amorphus orientalis]|uniref:Antirestriction protein n=1 Tax=Amorphus orientalis TaxID=649198 RepID=A0AAE3VT72_9HYPH|nr:antirestriction protein ArdA [Amorphus orientalis]MDQ0317767.1 antirestriction protein [Amorphus orientalis]
MRIYVADLAAYNNGILHGKWINATDDVADMSREISDMLKASPCPNVMREDWICDDCGETKRRTLSDFGPNPVPECPECGDPMRLVERFRSAEEYAIHDHEGLGKLGEYAGLDEVARRATIAEAAEDARIPVSVLIEAMNDYADDDEDAEDFISDRYRGCFDSWRDMAQEFTEETHDMSEIPEWLQGHIDWDSVARDFQCAGDVVAYVDDYHHYFFWTH